jgi:hypothetical protein
VSSPGPSVPWRLRSAYHLPFRSAWPQAVGRGPGRVWHHRSRRRRVAGADLCCHVGQAREGVSRRSLQAAKSARLKALRWPKRRPEKRNEPRNRGHHLRSCQPCCDHRRGYNCSKLLAATTVSVDQGCLRIKQWLGPKPQTPSTSTSAAECQCAHNPRYEPGNPRGSARWVPLYFISRF